MLARRQSTVLARRGGLARNPNTQHKRLNFQPKQASLLVIFITTVVTCSALRRNSISSLHSRNSADGTGYTKSTLFSCKNPWRSRQDLGLPRSE